MKNKYIIISTLLFSLFTISSCDEELELFPLDAIATDLGFNNETDFDNALRGVYSGFRRSGYYGATSGAPSIYFIPDVITDNVIINSNGRRSRETFYDWRYDEDNSSEVFWLSAYKVIQRANLILENVDNLEDGAIKDKVRGEALAARGLAHFDLAKFYAASPNQGSGEGIPYVTATDASLLPARNTLEETYTNIIKDLTDASTSIAETNGGGRINKNVVMGMLSRIYLFMGDYNKSLEAANSVSGVSEISRDNFLDLWKDATDESVLWKLEIVDSDNVSIGVAWLQESPDGIRSEYNVDFSLFQLYNDNDIRKEVYFETSDFAGVTYNHIVKYRGRFSGDANVVDAKILRYSEVLLNKAEAMAELGMEEGALSALDELRVNRYADFVSNQETGQALKDAISLERRLELAFEGHRFFDLKRKGLGITRSSFGDRADGTGQEAEFKELPAGNHRFNMAVGTTERSANPNMSQNPGY